MFDQIKSPLECIMRYFLSFWTSLNIDIVPIGTNAKGIVFFPRHNDRVKQHTNLHIKGLLFNSGSAD